jgi:hypothetical protein
VYAQYFANKPSAAQTPPFTQLTVYSPQHRLPCTQTPCFAHHLPQLYSWGGRLELSKISTSFPSVPAFPLNQRHKRKTRYLYLQYCTWRQQVAPQRRYISTGFHSFIFQVALMIDSEIYIKWWCTAVETLVCRMLRVSHTQLSATPRRRKAECRFSSTYVRENRWNLNALRRQMERIYCSREDI